MPDVYRLTATEQITLVRKGELTPKDLVDASFERIDALNSTLGAFVHVQDRSMVARMTAANPGKYPIPVSIKDLTLTKDMPTQYGSLVTLGLRPPFDADVVDAMREAGLVAVGKTGSSEFGSSIICTTRAFPPVRNPWNPADEASGGSSGGAAVSVATGMVPWAQGSDGGGSNRVPAALCGVFGYKPTRGAVSHGPFNSPMFGLPVNGPLARCVRDIQLLTAIMSKPYAGEHYPSPRHGATLLQDWERPSADCDFSAKTVLCSSQPMFAEARVDVRVLNAYEAIRDRLDALGCRVVDLPRPLFDPSIGDSFTSLQAVMAGYPVSAAEELLLTEMSRVLLAMAQQISAKQALQIWSTIQDACRRALRNIPPHDFILTPVTTRPTLRLDEFDDYHGPSRLLAEREFSPYCQAFTLTGQPALSAPVWLAGQDRPLSVMLAAHPGDDSALLTFARALEEAKVFECRLPEIS